MHRVVDEILHEPHREPTILAVQEPPLYKGTIRGLSSNSRSIIHKGENAPLAAIVINDGSIPHMGLQHLTTECVAVATLGLHPNSLHIVSAYCPPSKPLEPIVDQLEEIVRHFPTNLIICTDSNAWNSAWGSRHNNPRGRIIGEMILRTGLVLLNDPDSIPTFSGPQGCSHIDITLASPDVVPRIKSWKAEHNTCSDHATVYTEVILEAPMPRTPLSTRVFGEKEANWEKYRETLGALMAGLAFQELPNTTERCGILNQQVNDLQDNISKAASLSLPQIRSTPWRPKRWWSQEIAAARRCVIAARKNYQRSQDNEMRKVQYTLLVKLRRSLRRKIENPKKLSWRQFVTDCSVGGPWGKAYVAAKAPPSDKTANPAFPFEGIFPTDIPTSEMNILKGVFGEDDPDLDSPEQALIRARAEVPTGSDMLPPWDSWDIEIAVDNINKKGAPGIDGITGTMLRHSKSAIAAHLLDVFNGCLDSGFFPDRWKIACVLLFKKKGPRDLTLPSSYRPICLLPILGKVLEYIIKASLVPFIEPMLHDRQFGRRKNRSTEEAIRKLFEECSSGDFKYVTVILFDIAGAFDSAWWPAILRALQQMNVPSNLYALMVSYFQNRRARIFPSFLDSPEYRLTKGCPQGSILGPVLWLALFNGLLENLEAINISSIAYVDDLAVIARGNSRRAVQAEAERAAKSVHDWCTSVKMKVSVAKTAASVAKGSYDKHHPPRILVEGKKISFPDTITYLGVTLGMHLNISPHISSLTDKIIRFLLIINKISAVTWGMKYDQTAIMYKSAVAGIIQYSITAWSGEMRSRHWMTLTRLQRILLIRICKAYRTVSTDALCVIAGIPPLDLTIKSTVAKRCTLKNYTYPSWLPVDLRRGLDQLKSNPANVTRNNITECCEKFVMEAWESRWMQTSKGANTKHFFPSVSSRLKSPWIKPNYHTSQFLSGHGNFNDYLYKFKRINNSSCSCGHATETMLHALLSCENYAAARVALSRSLYNYAPKPADMVTSAEAFGAFVNFIEKWRQSKGSL